LQGKLNMASGTDKPRSSRDSADDSATSRCTDMRDAASICGLALRQSRLARPRLGGRRARAFSAAAARPRHGWAQWQGPQPPGVPCATRQAGNPPCDAHHRQVDRLRALDEPSSRAGPPGREAGRTSRATVMATRSCSRCSHLIWAPDGSAGLVGQPRRSVSSSSSWRWLTASVRSRRLLAAM
jgi:hypothetical protein